MDPGGAQGGTRGLHLAGQVRGPQACHRGAHVGKGSTGQGDDLVELPGGGGRVTLDEPAGDLGLESEHRQGVPQDVVDVAPERLSLGDKGELALGGCSALLKLQRDAGDDDGQSR